MKWGAAIAVFLVVTTGFLVPAKVGASPSAPQWQPSIHEVTANGAVYGPTFNGPISRLNKPIVGIASTPSGNGYWLVGADGGVFSFGGAQFFGSAAPLRLNEPIVGMASTPSGGGYWLVAADGGVFSFGDAQFFGSTAGAHFNAPVISITSTANGEGYWMDASDGGIFAFGNAGFFGASPGAPGSVVGPLMPTPDSQGYWLARTAEGDQAFGDASAGTTAESEGGGYVYPPAVGAAADVGGEVNVAPS
jgi:hypothetical protein